MDDLDLNTYLRRKMSQEKDSIQEVLMDGVLKDMEHYKNLQGRLEMLKIVEMHITEFHKENKF
tara:strand:+ start:347 stop:535 length:189 start_codon:yes stop_codon:yes gene_type:complete